MKSTLACAILCGGQSSRFGDDKALLPVQGRTLLQHICLTALEVTSEVYAIGATRSAHQLPPAVQQLEDAPNLQGPKAGIASLLQHTRSDKVLILALDYPGVTSAFLRELANNTSAQIDAVIVTNDKPQYLLGCYHREAMSRMLEHPFASIHRCITAADLTVEFATQEAFNLTASQWQQRTQNINQQSDWTSWLANNKA